MTSKSRPHRRGVPRDGSHPAVVFPIAPASARRPFDLGHTEKGDEICILLDGKDRKCVTLIRTKRTAVFLDEVRGLGVMGIALSNPVHPGNQILTRVNRILRWGESLTIKVGTGPTRPCFILPRIRGIYVNGGRVL